MHFGTFYCTAFYCSAFVVHFTQNDITSRKNRNPKEKEKVERGREEGRGQKESEWRERKRSLRRGKCEVYCIRKKHYRKITGIQKNVTFIQKVEENTVAF